jgi:hypothetical protein
LEDTIEFFKALHVYQGMRERKEEEEKKPIVTKPPLK